MRRIGTLRVLLGVLLLIPQSLEANGRALALTLKDALRLAKERNIHLVVAQERVQQSLYRITQRSADFWPQLSVAASQKRQTRDLRSAGIQLGTSDPKVGPFNSYDARLQLTQTIFDAGAMARLRVAWDNQKLSQAQYRKVEQDVLALVANFYLEAKLAAQKIELSKALLKKDDLNLRLAYRRFDLGVGSALEKKRARADYAQSLSMYRSAIAEAMESRLDLLAALGFESGEKIIFADDDKDVMISESDLKEQINDISLLPEVNAAYEDLQQKISEQSQEKSEYLPKVSAVADYGASGVDPDEASETYTLGLQASLPIFEGGSRGAQVREAESKVNESEAFWKDTQRTTRARIVNARQAIGKMKSILLEKETALSAAKAEFSLAAQRMSAGLGDQLQVKELKANLAVAQDAYNEAQAGYVLAQVELLHALGKMDQLIAGHD